MSTDVRAQPLTVSVIVVAPGSCEHLTDCLESLARQRVFPKQVFVAGWNVSEPFPVNPEVIFRLCRGRGELPFLLEQVIHESAADTVILTSAQSRFPNDWTSRMLSHHRAGFDVVGGAVRHGGPDSRCAWACYFAEYGAFSPGRVPSSTPPLFAGNHVSYRRDVLASAPSIRQVGYWKYLLHRELRQKGARFLFDPDLQVETFQVWRLGNFVSNYFYNGSLFAAVRWRKARRSSRLVRAILGPLLLPMLLYRRLSAAWPDRIHRARLVGSVPYLIGFVGAWVAGEMYGCVFGTTETAARPS